MCFTTFTDQFKIAEKPIRVYKILIQKSAPIYDYKYHKGLNTPESLCPDSNKIPHCFNIYQFYGGVLHCYKNKKYTRYNVVTMYIPFGARYNDCGVGYSYDEVITDALYWPKNIFERIYYYIISKKY